MWLLEFHLLVVLVSASCLPSLNAATCEEIETSNVKLDLVKQTINNVKALYPKCVQDTDQSNCTAKDRSLAYLNTALDLISEANTSCHASSCVQSLNATRCEETETAIVKLDLAKQSIKSSKHFYPECRDETYESNCSVKDRFTAHLNVALELISEVNMTCHTCPETKEVIEDTYRPMDCSDVQTMISNSSGVYTIWPRIANSSERFEVYCDMETDGGGWTVIQRRGDFPNQTDFYQDWKTYKNGFGDLEQDFWLGNDKIHALTSQSSYSVRFDLTDVKREHRYSGYKIFSVDDEESGYRLTIMDHYGNANGDLERTYNTQKFSTKDRKNDGRGNGEECAKMHHSAFWFNPGCGSINLNGIYQPGVINQKGIWWHNWKKTYECLYSVEIKIRRADL